jgi:hypothetical protein
MRRLLPVVLGTASVLVFASTAALSADSTGNNGNADNQTNLRLASPGDPYRSCQVIGANSTYVNYPNTELEPWLAANPANPRNLIGSYQQDRWLDGGAKGLVASYSMNAGNTWKAVPLPFSECAAPYYGGNVLHYERVSDPWNSIGVDGIAYAVSLDLNGNGTNAVGAARSVNGGRTWTNQQEIIRDDITAFNDKESVTADPMVPKTAYAVWDRSQVAPCGPGQKPAAPLVEERPGYFSRTTDGGVTWEKPRAIVPTKPNDATLGHIIVVDRVTGALHDFFTYFGVQGLTVQVADSLDKGTHWGPAHLVSDEQAVSVFDPRQRDRITIRAGAIVQPAVDPNTGQLYVAWEDARYNRMTNDQAVISTSTDGGATWSVPSLISPPNDPAAFMPVIDVNKAGQVGAIFYDFRSLKSSTPLNILPTDTWFRRTDGPGVAFTHEQHLSRHNILMTPAVFGGFFVGDYEGLAAQPNGNAFFAYYSQATCSDDSCPVAGNGIGAPASGPDPQDIVATRIPDGNDDQQQ